MGLTSQGEGVMMENTEKKYYERSRNKQKSVYLYPVSEVFLQMMKENKKILGGYNNTELSELSYEELYDMLPEETKVEYQRKRQQFLAASGLSD